MMVSSKVRGSLIALAVATLTVSSAAAQSTPVDPSTASKTNPNPATSSSTDDQGHNPLARDGDHSPTGQNAGNLPPAGNPNAGQGTVGQNPPSGPSAGSSQKDVNERGEPKGGRAVTPD